MLAAQASRPRRRELLRAMADEGHAAQSPAARSLPGSTDLMGVRCLPEGSPHRRRPAAIRVGRQEARHGRPSFPTPGAVCGVTGHGRPIACPM
jgi:hypothetical protein